jgi:hypothetical protein
MTPRRSRLGLGRLRTETDDGARERNQIHLAAVYNQLLDRTENTNNTTTRKAGEHAHLTGSPA